MIKLITETVQVPNNFTGISEDDKGNRYYLVNGKLHRDKDLPAIDH